MTRPNWPPLYRYDFLSLVKLNQLDGNVATFYILHLSIISYKLFLYFFIWVLIRANLKFFSHSISRMIFFCNILFWSIVITIIIIFAVVIFLTFAIAMEKSYLFFYFSYALFLWIKAFCNQTTLKELKFKLAQFLFIIIYSPSVRSICKRLEERGRQIGRKYFLSSNYLDNMKPKDK